MDTTVEKAQQEPQEPWFFTSATRPLARQSTAAGAGSPEGVCVLVDIYVAGMAEGVKPLRVLKAAGARSAYSLRCSPTPAACCRCAARTRSTLSR